MAKAFVSFNDDTMTEKAFADLTVSYSKDIDGGAVATTNCVLTELGLGEYILSNPNITTKRVIMRCYLTSDSTKKIRVGFDPADGSIAKIGDEMALNVLHRDFTITGTAQGGTINSITLAADSAMSQNLMRCAKIAIYEGTGAGQGARGITDYNSTSKVCGVARNWEVTPDNTSKYKILNDFGPKVNPQLEVTAIDMTTVLARIGAFTGTGLNTLLGFFRALLRKDADLTPSDVGGTYNNVTDSAEANQTEHYATQTLINEKVAGSTILNIISAVNGSINVESVLDGGIITVYRKTSVAIPINLGKSMAGRKLYFAVRKDISDAAYTIPNGGTTPKEITLTMDLPTGSGYVGLTPTELDIAAGLYVYAEIQSVSNAGGDPIPEQIFQLRVKNHALNL